MSEINENNIELLKGTIDQILKRIGIDGTVFARIVEPFEDQKVFTNSLEQEGKEIIVFNIKTNDANILIGRNGENLLALQHLIRILARRKDKELIPFNLDINNYRKEKGEKLQGIAKIAAEKARKTKKRIILRPMPAYERRLVHLFLSSEKDLITKSEGIDPDRKITVSFNGDMTKTALYRTESVEKTA